MEIQIPDSNNVTDFIEEVKQPTAPAMEQGGQPLYTPPPPGNSPEPDKPAYIPPEGSQPLFNNEDIPQQGQQAAPKISKGYEDKVIMGIIRAEDHLTSTITALIAGQEDTTPFKASESDQQDLFDMLEPFREWILDKCPAALPLILVYGTIKTKQFAAGRKARIANKANREGANNSDTVQRIANAGQGGERTNYVLYIDGYYRNTRNGKYIKRPSENHLREQPNIADIDKILSVKNNQERDLLAQAFGWTAADFTKHGIS